jgi:hypothetical protein
MALLWLAAGGALAATTSTTGAGPFTLEQDGTVLQADLPTLVACETAARARAEAARASRRYVCRQAARVDVVYSATAAARPASSPSGVAAPSVSVSPGTYPAGGYATIVWSGTAPCSASAEPSYAPWSGDKAASGGQSVAPNVTTVFTLACANGKRTAKLTVTGAPPTLPAQAGGGAAAAPVPAIANLPVPAVLPQPVALPVRRSAASDPIHDFAQTALRNWNHGGHQVPVTFERGQGFWSPETCVQDYATWLFDRPTAWFKYAELAGNERFRQVAVDELRFYASHINAAGIFDCKTGEADTKYLNVRPFLLFERATADQSLRPVAARLYAQSAQGFGATPPAGNDLWTEREVGIHGDAALAYYELTGNTQALARAGSLVKLWTDMSGTRGAPMVTYTQHEGGGPGGSQPTDLVNSPWMSAIYFQFARNYWQVTGDEQVLRQVSAYFEWLDANGLYDGSLAHPEFSGLTFPRYLGGTLIGDAGYDEGNMNHCPAVQGLVAFAVDARRRLQLPTARAEQRLRQLQGCTARMWANWTRTATQYPRYRIQNPRFWNLWAAGLYEAAR